MITFDRNPCEQSEVTCAYAAQALAASEVAAAEAHIASCADCQRELEDVLRQARRAFAARREPAARPLSLARSDGRGEAIAAGCRSIMPFQTRRWSS